MKPGGDPHSWEWKEENPVFGPWYKGKIGSGSNVAHLMVQPDMDNSRWYWSVKFNQTPHHDEKRYWGREPDKHTAMAVAYATGAKGRYQDE